MGDDKLYGRAAVGHRPLNRNFLVCWRAHGRSGHAAAGELWANAGPQRAPCLGWPRRTPGRGVAVAHISVAKRDAPLKALDLEISRWAELVRDASEAVLTADGVWLPAERAAERAGADASEPHAALLLSGLTPRVALRVSGASLANYARALAEHDAAARCNPKKQRCAEGGDTPPRPCVLRCEGASRARCRESVSTHRMAWCGGDPEM